MIRYQTVEGMRSGQSAASAAEQAVKRISQYYPDYSGAVIAVSIDGLYGM